MKLARAWMESHCCDPLARELADRHYSRQKPGTSRFVNPGRCLVLLTPALDAVWVTSWPFKKYVKHQWAGAWTCAMFRNEGTTLSSELVRQAVAVTRWKYPKVPPEGFITFVNPGKVRKKRDWGRCFRKAGFKYVGETKGGLVALHMAEADMPEPAAPIGTRV